MYHKYKLLLYTLFKFHDRRFPLSYHLPVKKEGYTHFEKAGVLYSIRFFRRIYNEEKVDRIFLCFFCTADV